MMTVIATPLGEGPAIGILRFRTEESDLLPVPGHAIPAQVIEVGSERRGFPLCRTTRALTSAPRVRAVMKRLA